MSQLLAPLWSISSQASASVVILFAVTFLTGLYYYLLPKAIPGNIPYNKSSRQRLLGDLPDLLKNVAVTENPFCFFNDQVEKLQSPIIQIWMKPFCRPVLVVADPATSEEIQLRRNKEFDRSQFIKDVFSPNIPNHHFVLSTNEQFRAQRKIINDAVSPAFLRDVGAVRVQESVVELVDLWRLKERLAEGKPFRANQDLKNAVFDAIWSIATGEKPKGIKTELEYLEEHQDAVKENDATVSVEFPKAQLPEIFDSVHLMLEAFASVVSSPMPRLHHHILKLFPKLKAAYRTKERVLTRLLEEARARYVSSEEEKKKAAIDWFLYRDNQRAEKTGEHIPEEVIRDEVMGFLLAGHETTSTSLAWTVKFLSEYPAYQTQLRQSLQSAFPTRTPSSLEIESAQIPYLDAFIEECLRNAMTAPGASRTTIVDTEILGHFVPKGTEVFLMGNGAGYTTPSLTGGKIPWERPAEFWPGRWLGKEKGEFDQQAGPIHGFGLGLRGCWGKKLAYIEMRAVVTLLVLSFEFEKVPEELAGFEGHQGVTNEPRKCYVKLRVLGD